jgi:hypothetical protein
MHPPAPPPLPKRKNGLWGALSTTNNAIDFLFALVLPLPFAAPLGVGLVLVCLKFFESMSGEGWLAAFTIGYSATVSVAGCS